MYTTSLEKLGVQVSRLGFGAMRLPTKEGAVDVSAATKLIRHAYENGINYFDTAWPYHGGQSEVVLGEALRDYPRESYLLADKLPLWMCETLEDCQQRFEEQLQRCGVDHFDFYLLHGINRRRWKKVQQLGILELMERYRREGRIRFLGFSFHDDCATFETVLDAYTWDFAQIQANFVDEVLQQAGTLYDMLCQRRIPCIVMEPVRGGSLARLPQRAQTVLERAAADTPAVQWPSPAHWALRWCLGHDNMRVVLSGMSNMQQLEENIALFSQAPPLNAEEVALLHEARDIILSARSVPCTGCGYCSCRFGVDIPGVFSAYNHYELLEDEARARFSYRMVTPEHDAGVCTRCGACVPLCPQSIDIPTELSRVHGVIAELMEKRAALKG